MAKKKAAARKKTAKKKTVKNKIDTRFSVNILKTLAALTLLVGLVFSAGFLANRFISPVKEKTPSTPDQKIVRQGTKPPKFEIYPKEERPPYKKIRLPDMGRKLPKVAIIIDDLGYDSSIAKQFLNLDAVLTFSILPHSPLQKKLAKAARKKGYEIILHLPMEPFEYPAANPGPGVLLASMSPDTLIHQLKLNLDAVPYISGVNNHMGSKITADSTKMRQIFTILKKRGLFFIDSRTTKETLCRASAGLLHIPFAERDVFLDHDQSPDAIRRQIRRLIQIAEKQGEAIGIGHPHTSTYKVLQDELGNLKTKVRLVPASKIIHLVDATASG